MSATDNLSTIVIPGSGAELVMHVYLRTSPTAAESQRLERTSILAAN